MGLTLQRRLRRRDRKAAATKAKAAPRRNTELDELIDYGHAALVARGAAPLAMQLDTALRVAALHIRRSADNGDDVEDLRWAVRLASFVSEKCAGVPPAGVIELSARALAILEHCAAKLPIGEAVEVRRVVVRTRVRVERAEQLCALSIDKAIAQLAIAEQLLADPPPGPDGEQVVASARALATAAVVGARRAGQPQLAEAALGLLAGTGNPAPRTTGAPDLAAD